MSEKTVKVQALRSVFCSGVDLELGEVREIPQSVAYAMGHAVKILKSKSEDKRESEQKQAKAKVTKDMKSKEVANKDMSEGGLEGSEVTPGDVNQTEK